LSFRVYTRADYFLFCERVFVGFYTNSAVFPASPVSHSEFEIVFTKYSEIEVQYKIAPSINKNNFVAAKTDMDTTLMKIADYVNSIADGNESTIRLAGFLPTKNTTSRSAPITEEATGKLKRGPGIGQITVESIALKGKGTVNYSVVVAIGAPLPATSFDNGQFLVNSTTVNCVLNYTRSRKKVISDLPPGSKVYVYFWRPIR